MPEINEEEQQDFSQITVADVFEKKVEFQTLPEVERERLINEYRESLPTPEDRFLSREFGYAPEGMHGGKGRDGSPVRVKPWEEFKQDILHKAKSNKSSEVDKIREQNAAMQKQIEEMAALVKMQTTTSLASEEERIDTKLQELTTNGIYEKEDFQLYNNLLKRKEELEQRKKITLPEPREQRREITEYKYSPAEREAIDDFKASHKDFVSTIIESKSYSDTFDDHVALATRRRPDLTPKEILAYAKKSMEDMYPNVFKTNNVFMNNYTPPQSNNFIKKQEASKIVFENLSDTDKRIIIGSARNYPGKTYQEVAETLFGHLLKKNK